jgi:hypothetical protein
MNAAIILSGVANDAMYMPPPSAGMANDAVKEDLKTDPVHGSYNRKYIHKAETII